MQETQFSAIMKPVCGVLWGWAWSLLTWGPSDLLVAHWKTQRLPLNFSVCILPARQQYLELHGGLKQWLHRCIGETDQAEASALLVDSSPEVAFEPWTNSGKSGEGSIVMGPCICVGLWWGLASPRCLGCTYLKGTGPLEDLPGWSNLK